MGFPEELADIEWLEKYLKHMASEATQSRSTMLAREVYMIWNPGKLAYFLNMIAGSEQVQIDFLTHYEYERKLCNEDPNRGEFFLIFL